jgi:hypothetical protein
MFCPKCGKETVDSTDAFCRHCGYSINSSTPLTQDNNVTVKNVYAGKNLQIAGLAVFLLCSLAGCSVIHDSAEMGSLLLLGAVVGLVMYLMGRYDHWYHAE